VTPYYQHGGITIYHGDCREIVHSLTGIEAIVSDPPYGMSWDGKVTRGSECGKSNRKGTATAGYGKTIIGDDVRFDASRFMFAPEVLLWGFNHFPDQLNKGTALVWLKRYDGAFGSFLSDAEIAWLNRGCGVYCRRDVSMQGDSRFRAHPTQKPVGLMEWCLSFIKGRVVLDPFAGSGSTLVAAKNMNRHAIGIEIEERYCEIAAKRLEQEVLPLEAA
jgi:site-specific DNA-methyltransferase (adenine-specific)